MARKHSKQIKSSDKVSHSSLRNDRSDNSSSDKPWNTLRIVAYSFLVAAVATVYYLFVSNGKIFDRSKEPTHFDTGRPFDVVDIPGKGKGIIASRDIQQGELLIKEPPLVLVPSSTTLSPIQLLRERLDALTPKQREQYYSLSYVASGKARSLLSEDDITLAIFQTNAIAAGENVGLFPQVARLNHGCSAAFNSVYSWRSKEGELFVHAIKPIKRGEELLTTYTNTKKPRHERQAYLKSNYDFTCSCSVCTLSEADSAASDERLTKMSSLNQKFASWGQSQIDGLEVSRIAKEIWQLGEEEGYWSERGRLAADVVYVAAAHSDEKGLLAWASVAQIWSGVELGNDSVQALAMQAVLENPRSHPIWGSRQPQTIELPDR